MPSRLPRARVTRARVTRAAAAALAAALAAGLLVLPAAPAQAVSPDVVITEVYGGGGNSGAPYSNDFVELYNPTQTDVDVDGWSVQYASSTGSSWQVTTLAGTVPAGGHYLVQEAAGSTPSTTLPAPDATGAIAMAAGAGKVALVIADEALTCGSDCDTAAGVRDFAGYGTTADDFEGAGPTPAPSNTTSVQRDADGTDTDQNGADFTAAAPTPENSGVEPEPVAIHDIQGADHLSPLDGRSVVDVPGVVTRRSSNGFWMQDPEPDDDAATSEGIFVFTGAAPAGDAVTGATVLVDGTVDEFRPGGSTSSNLTTTEITGTTVDVTGNTSPLAPAVIGPGGRVPPSAVIDDDATGSVETSGSFDEQTDGIDFYESLEGMHLALEAPDVVGPTNSFGELPVVTAGAGPRTGRGGIVISGTDFNPERVILDALTGTMPTADVGDTLDGTVTGVLDYSFGNFKLYVDTPPTVTPGGITRETAASADADELSVATYNVENLSPVDDQAKFDELAAGIVDGLAAPDVVTLEEVQDNTGPTDDGVVAADQTLDRLVAAIEEAGGPSYDWRQITPEDGEDGGQPGGNIRVAFLFRTDRGLAFVDRPGGDASTAVEVVGSGAATRLSASPGRIDPENRAWLDSRKPLVGEFRWAGRTVFVIANHFASKGGDEPLFGRFQPPDRVSEVQRHRQAQQVRRFVDELLAADPGARVVVAGDLNDFQFSETADILVGSGGDTLTDLPRTLPLGQQYTYVFDGNSQVLDHLMLSPRLGSDGYAYDIVHANAEFADQVSDHDPQVVHLAVDAPDVTRVGIRAHPQATTFGGPVELSGRLTSGRAGLEGYPIVVQERPAGTTAWSPAGRATTGADGGWSLAVRPRSTTDYRAVYRGGEDLASTSGVRTVGVRPRVSARPSDRTVDRGDRVQVAGVVSPSDAVETVRLERRFSTGWRPVVSAAVGPDGGYALRWDARPRGTVLLRVATPSNARFLAGHSRSFRVTVR